MTLVSVLMPIKGNSPFLAHAIQSVRFQTYQNWELIVCKDSVDLASEVYLKKIADLDARIKLVDTVSLPLPSALNKGLDECRGDLVARFDADDIMLPNRLKDQVGFFTSNPDVIACGGQVMIIDEQSNLRLKAPYYNQDDRALKSKLDFKCPFPHPGVTVSRRALAQVGGYSPQFRFAEDYELWLRLSHLGKFANLRKPVIAYRSYSSQTSARYRTETRLHMAVALTRELSRNKPDAADIESPINAACFQKEYSRLTEPQKKMVKGLYGADSFFHEVTDQAHKANLRHGALSNILHFVFAIPRRFTHAFLRFINFFYSYPRVRRLWSHYLQRLSLDPIPLQSDIYLER